MEMLILDNNFKAIRIVSVFKSLIWTDRYNSNGDFEICLSMASDVIKDLKPDYYLVTDESEHCMIIDGSTITTDIEDGDYYLTTGKSLEYILDRRIVWGQKVVNGNLQDCIHTLINDAIISPTDVNRKIDNFIFETSTDPKITALTVNAQYTGDNLFTVIKGLCEVNNIGFKIILNDSDQFVFSLYAGVDRSYNQDINPYVIFSPEYNNMLNSNYLMSKAGFRNVSLVAGEGEGAARKTTTVGAGSGLERRELFTDANGVSSNTDSGTLTDAEYLAQLASEGNKKLAENGIKIAFEGEVEATDNEESEVTKPFKYGIDFFMGDIVQVEDRYGNTGSSRVSELVISQDNENGFSMHPTFKTI